MDHNHQTMEIRGLLCVRCNRSVRDWMTPEWAIRLAFYLIGSSLSEQAQVLRTLCTNVLTALGLSPRTHFGSTNTKENE